MLLKSFIILQFILRLSATCFAASYTFVLNDDKLNISGLLLPTGLAFHNNFLYIVDTGNKRVVKVDLSAAVATPEIIAQDFDIPISIAINTNDDSIYISDIHTNSIYRITKCRNIFKIFIINSVPSSSILVLALRSVCNCFFLFFVSVIAVDKPLASIN